MPQSISLAQDLVGMRKQMIIELVAKRLCRKLPDIMPYSSLSGAHDAFSPGQAVHHLSPSGQ